MAAFARLNILNIKIVRSDRHGSAVVAPRQSSVPCVKAVDRQWSVSSEARHQSRLCYPATSHINTSGIAGNVKVKGTKILDQSAKSSSRNDDGVVYRTVSGLVYRRRVAP